MDQKIKDSIYNILLKNILKKGWKEEDDEKKFELELYPYNSKIPIKYRYLKLIIKNNDKDYEGTLLVENFKFSLLYNDEDYQDDSGDFLQFEFESKKKHLKECVLDMLDKLINIDNCNSCNRIYEKYNLDEGTCIHCLLQYHMDIIEEDCECAICLDKEVIKLYYKLPCEHNFHFNCLSKMKKLQCPLCRTPFNFYK